MRRGASLVAMLAAAAVVAPATHAAEVAMPAGSFYGYGHYTASPGERNAVVVRGLSPSSFAVADRGGAPIAAYSNDLGGICRSLGMAADCVLGLGPVVPETAIVTGGALYNPFSGHEIILELGDGDDSAAALDGFTTLVDCGTGDDTAVVEARDETRDCETVHRA